MIKLIKFGGAIVGSSCLLGVLNGKFNKPTSLLPKFDQKEFEEKMKVLDSLNIKYM